MEENQKLPSKNDHDDFVQNPVWRDIKRTLGERREALLAEVLEMDILQCKEIKLIDTLLEAPRDLRALLKEEEEHG